MNDERFLGRAPGSAPVNWEWLGSMVGPWGLAGFSAGGGFFMLRWFVEWLSGRLDKKQEQIDAAFERLDEGTQLLITQLREQIDYLLNRDARLTQEVRSLEERLQECMRLHAESDAKNLRLEALLQGYGDVRNQAQTIIAADKMEKKE